ncbi:parallel beta-helix repeat protein [Methanococcus maripaludis]|uniref:Parallel beta-helix repeat protein n=1 Tax=Methanococcus maripaludis TaxID=39152 RepID=A0A7J9P313_METMI|nr:NosD domain-containing protein [Methanococcus maripaludis]MBA2853824.1 parallel beta-helix repeat protein [Methanococcus maripaludis]
MKNPNFKTIIFLTFLISLTFISSVSADTAINDSCTISSTATYYLNNNINCSSGTAITITCDDVVIDGNGYIIDGTGTGSYGIYAMGPCTNITLKNLNVENFEYGIYLENVENIILNNNTANGNELGGIYVQSSSNVTFIGNTADSNTNCGIVSSFSSNNKIINNTVKSNGKRGIGLYYSSNSTITNNIASSNKKYGIYLLSSSNITIKNNTADSNYPGGGFPDSSSNIYLDSSSNNTVINNNINSSYYGIYLDSSDDNEVTNNTADSNTIYSIYLDSSDNNKVTGNSANLGNYGIGLVSSSNNTFTSNTVNSTFQRGAIELQSSSNNVLIKNTVNSNYHGICLFSSSNNNTITGNNVFLNNQTAILISSSDNNTITNNTVDSNNYGIFIFSSSDNNTITNNTVDSNNWGGIYLDSSSDNKIINNSAKSNGQRGIYLDSSSNNIILNNNATLNDDCGIYLQFSSDNNTITGNTANSNNESGIQTDYSSDNKIINNTANSNIRNGIHSYYSSDNKIINNTANSNTGTGISLVYSENNTITDNNASLNHCGISLSSSNNSIVHNTIYLNNYGIYIGDYENNSIYINIFNNTDNLYLSSYSVIGKNYWNTSKEQGGGNYWFIPTGTGFSEITPDWNNDGYCDYQYNLTVNNTDYLPILWDKSIPEINIITPVNETAYNTSSISINITANDSLSNISSVTVEIKNIINISLTLNESYYMRYTGNLSDGVYNITVTAVDLKGNTNTTEPITFTVDTINPEVVINHKEDDYNYSTNILNVTVDDASAVTVVAEINNENMSQNIALENISGYFGNTTHEFAQGEYSVRIYAEDLAGNVNSSETVEFMVDWTAPIVSIEIPTNGSYISFTNLKLNVTATDNVCESVMCNISVNGVTVNSSEVNTSETLLFDLTITEGENNISVVSIDDNGNIGENTTTVIVDTVKPEVTVNTVEKSYNYNSSILNITATDINLDSVLAEVNGLKNITLNGSAGYFVTNEEFNEGLYSVKIYAIDLAGNVNSTENVTFRVDLTDPVITVNTEEGAYFNNGSNVLNFTVDEDYIDSVTAFNGSSEILLNNSTGNYLNANELADGVYNVTMYANDTASNKVNKTASFTVDTVNPEVTFNSPVNGTTFTTSSAAINVTANDSLSNVSSVIAKIGNVGNVTLSFDGNYYTGNTETLSNGNYEITVYATDLAGNVNSSENVTITVAVPSSSSGGGGSSYSSDLSDGITSSVIKTAVSNSNIVYGSEIDGEYAGELRENMYNAENYELSRDTIIVGGPESNGFANRYDSEFEISITNDYPRENRGVIQIQNIQVHVGNFIKTYQVIYIAGSDRYGTQAALEYFKTLDELPDGPITVEWTANGPVLVE